MEEQLRKALAEIIEAWDSVHASRDQKDEILLHTAIEAAGSRVGAVEGSPRRSSLIA